MSRQKLKNWLKRCNSGSSDDVKPFQHNNEEIMLNRSEAKHDTVFSLMISQKLCQNTKQHWKKQEWTKIGKLAVMMWQQWKSEDFSMKLVISWCCCLSTHIAVATAALFASGHWLLLLLLSIAKCDFFFDVDGCCMFLLVDWWRKDLSLKREMTWSQWHSLCWFKVQKFQNSCTAGPLFRRSPAIWQFCSFGWLTCCFFHSVCWF